MTRTDTLTIAVDVMGTVEPLPVILEGLHDAQMEMREGRKVSFLLAGPRETIERELGRPAMRHLYTISRILEAPVVVEREDSPRACLRKYRTGESSVGVALQAVADGEASVAVSAGNTAGLILAAEDAYERLGGCKPAIAAQMPTSDRPTLLLDCGASPDVSAEDLLAFARMGAAASCALFGHEQAEAKLLSNGHSPNRANQLVKEAHKLLSAHEGTLLRFDPSSENGQGLIRGYEVLEGKCDIVVTDGFTGNLLLTGMEGVTARLKQVIDAEKRDVFGGALKYLAAAPLLVGVKDAFDRQRHNGGPILGYRHLLIKSHGAANATGIKNAVLRAYELAAADLISQIRERLGV